MENDEIIIDLGALFRALLKRWAFIAKVTVLFAVLAVVYLLIAKPVYESVALLQLKQQESVVKSSLSATGILDAQRTKQMVSTYNEIIVSPSVITPIIEKVEEPDENGLYPKPEVFAKKISTETLKDTNIVQLKVKAETPEKAKQTNDLLIASLLTKLTGLAKDEFKDSRSFLEKRVEVAKKNLDDADNAIKAFKQEHDMSSPGKEMEFAMDQRQQLRNSLQSNEINKVTTQKKIDVLNERIENADTSTLADRLLAFYDRLELTKTETSVPIIESRLEELNKYSSENQKRVSELLDLSLELTEINRKRELAEDIYKMLAKRLEEAKVAEESTAKGVQVISEGTLNDKPVRPRKLLILAGAIFMGIFCSCGLVVVIELFNKKIANADDVAYYLELPVLGNIPDYDAMSGKNEAVKGLVAKLGRLVWGK